jgi:ribosomal 50S subunit-associated protein YjgA (DUF615 family)
MDKTEGKSQNNDLQIQQRLEQLKVEHNKLNTQKIATEQDRKNLESQLKTLRDKALADYGTSDLGELRNLLRQRREENEHKVEEYRKHIEGIKSQLQAIQREEPEE